MTADLAPEHPYKVKRLAELESEIKGSRYLPPDFAERGCDGGPPLTADGHENGEEENREQEPGGESVLAD